MGEKGEGFTGTILKDTWSIKRRGGNRGGRTGVVGRGGEKMKKTVLEQQKKNKEKIK